MLYAWGYVNVRCRTSQHALSFRVSGRGALSYSGAHASGNGDLHEAGSSGDHDVLHIWQRLEFGCASQYWGLLPDAKVLKEVLAGAIDACTTGSGHVQARVASRFTYHLRYHWYHLREEPSCRLFRLKRLLKYPFRTREKVQKGAAQGVSLLLLLLVWPSRGSFVRAPGDRRSRQARSEVVTTESKNCGDGSRATAIWRADCAGDRPNNVVTRACP